MACGTSIPGSHKIGTPENPRKSQRADPPGKGGIVSNGFRTNPPNGSKCLPLIGATAEMTFVSRRYVKGRRLVAESDSALEYLPLPEVTTREDDRSLERSIDAARSPRKSPRLPSDRA